MTKILAVALSLLVAAVIALGTLGPPGDGPPALPLTDKQAHFIAFALLVLPTGWFMPKRALWLAGVALLYGAAIELVQPLVGRSGEWGDLAADAAGVAAGLLPGLIRRWRMKKAAARQKDRPRTRPGAAARRDGTPAQGPGRE